MKTKIFCFEMNTLQQTDIKPWRFGKTWFYAVGGPSEPLNISTTRNSWVTQFRG